MHGGFALLVNCAPLVVLFARLSKKYGACARHVKIWKAVRSRTQDVPVLAGWGGKSSAPKGSAPTVCSRVTGMHKNRAEVFRHAHGLKPAYVADDGRDMWKHRSGRAEGEKMLGQAGFCALEGQTCWWLKAGGEG